MNLMTSLRKEMLEMARTSRLLILIAVVGFFGLSSPLLAKYTPEILGFFPGAEQFTYLIPPPTVLDSVGQYIKNLSQFGILLAILLAMGMVAQEKERGTAAMMLTKPLARGSFLVSKFFALGMGFSAALAVAALGGYYYTLVLFEALDWGAWLALNGLLLIEILVYAALTLLFSTLVRSQAAAAGLGLAVLLVFSLLGSLPVVSGYLPGALVNWGTSLFTPTATSAWPALWISLGIILGSLLLAWGVFRRQEL